MDAVFGEKFPYQLTMALEETDDIGYGRVCQAIDPEFLERWAAELQAARFAPWGLDTGNGSAALGLRILEPSSRGLALTRLVQRELSMLVRGCDMGEFSRWRPNTVIVQRYPVGHPGLMAHQDPPIDLVVVALFTVTGSATFRAHTLHHRSVVQDEWEASAGSLTLLRGPALDGTRSDSRIPHSVSGPHGDSQRTVAGYLMVAGK